MGKKELNADFKENIKQLGSKIKHKTKESIAFMGYVLYFWNTDKLQAKLHPLPEIPPTIRIKSTGEKFELGKPAFFIDGKPLFVLLRGIPFSIEIEIKNSKYKIKNENGEKIPIIENKGYSANEIDAKLNSIYVNRIFRAKSLTTTHIIIFILSLLSSVLITSMFWMIYTD